MAFFQVPNMLLLLGTCMIGFILLHALKTRKKLLKIVTVELRLWILFAVFVLISGLLVAVNPAFLLKSIITFVESLLLIFGIIYISDQDRSINFFINIFILFSLICAITTVFWGVDFGGGRMAMGYADNPNTVGVTMMVGICCILYKLTLNRFIYAMAGICAVFLLVYVSVLTGSRKALISIALLILFWIMFVVIKERKRVSFIKKIKGILILLFIAGVCYFYFYPLLKDSPVFLRFSSLFKSESDIVRGNMYKEAFGFFIRSPIAGIGFNNYRVLSVYGTYSHSTYAEALSCTGIIGSLIYFAPYIIVFKSYMDILVKKNIEDSLYSKAKIMFGLFCVLVFLAASVIHFYEMISMITFGMLFAFKKIYMSTETNYQKQLTKQE